MDFTVISIVQNGVQNGIKYLVPLFVNCLLWILTIWIPYLNVGTTIGLWVGVMTKIARGEDVGMTEIFDAKYRARMGEFFLTYAFTAIGQWVGFLFFIIPGMVIGIAWMLAIPLVVDKGMNPMEAINKSNQVTYGKKWTIFFGYLLVVIALVIVYAIIMEIFKLIGVGFITFIAGILLSACMVSVIMGTYGYVYGALTK